MPSFRLLQLLCLGMFTLAPPASAITLDFEDLGANLPIQNPDSGAFEDYDNRFRAFRDGQPTDFDSQGATFHNQFDDFTAFAPSCCWRGWAYSQTTDTTTPGVGNQHSAYPGSGVAGSATYGVAFTGSEEGAPQRPVSRIDFAGSVDIGGGHFANTTYAALTMRDGDDFTTKFGGTSGDEPDFLSLTIFGVDAIGADTGSVEFVLADYRFVDNSEDYIRDVWTWVDLSSLGSVRALEFVLDSSDTSGGFLNTPSYFALDGLELTPVPEPTSAALLALGMLVLARRRL